MNIVKTTIKDIERVMEIIKEAQEYFKGRGIPQWQNGYPNEDVILADIKNGHSYILVKEDEIIATVAISFDGEDTYNKIYEGNWLSEDDFAVIHRIAVSNEFKGKGVAKIILDKAEQLCKDRDTYSIKIDTHKENLSMQRLVIKNGYKYCGIILLKDGSERVAFEKMI